MRAYAYEVTEQSPSALKDTYPLGTKFNAEVPVTVTEATDASRAGGPFFPDEAAVVAKAVAQMTISAVHLATDTVRKALKAGKPAPSAADIEALIQGFRYKTVTVRDPNAPKAAPGPNAGVVKALKEKALKFDANQAALVQKALEGKFGATALATLVETETIDLGALREAAAAWTGEVPAAVQKLLTQ